jgi:hypothetical protein
MVTLRQDLAIVIPNHIFLAQKLITLFSFLLSSCPCLEFNGVFAARFSYLFQIS